MLNDLERDGLVVRGQDDRDRRRNLIRLTPRGRSALKRLTLRIEDAQDSLLEPLATDERRQFERLLTRVVRHHREADPRF